MVTETGFKSSHLAQRKCEKTVCVSMGKERAFTRGKVQSKQKFSVYLVGVGGVWKVDKLAVVVYLKYSEGPMTAYSLMKNPDLVKSSSCTRS